MTEEKSGWDLIAALKDTHTHTHIIIAMTADLTDVSSQGEPHSFDEAPVAGLAYEIQI